MVTKMYWLNRLKCCFNRVAVLLDLSSSDDRLSTKPQRLEKLEQALVWSRNHPPQASDLDSLEKQLKIAAVEQVQIK